MTTFKKSELLSRRRESTGHRGASEDGSKAEIDGAHHKGAQRESAHTSSTPDSMKDFAAEHRGATIPKIKRDRELNERQARALAGDHAVDRAQQYGQF